MKERTIRHVYNCSEDAFWNRIFLDDDYNRSLFLDELHFDSWQVTRSERRGDEVHRTIEATPPLGELPAALKKLLTSGVGYEERGIADLAAKRYRLKVTPRSLASKVSVTGELYTRAIDDGHCERIYVASAEARVFGLASLIENRILDDVTRSYEKAASFTNRWIAERLDV